MEFNSENPTIAIIDDEVGIRDTIREIMEEQNYNVYEASSLEEAKLLPFQSIDTILLDIKLGMDNGFDVLDEIKLISPHLPVVMITGHGSVKLAAEAFKKGVYEFLEKPLRLIKIKTVIRNAIESYRLQNRVFEQNRKNRITAIYASSKMKKLLSSAVKLSTVKASVLINGESGSGKELVAECLHYEGNRREKPFIAINAATMSDTLAEDELFGHTIGAYTGASTARKGALERADGGTLFLDEIADLSLSTQAKLLRFIEKGTFIRLGGEDEIYADVRIVSATHKNVQSLVEKGEFREDLWFRLSTFVLDVPSLKDRVEDIEILADHFLKISNGEMQCEKTIDDDAMDALLKYEYPGNVRELKNIITRAVILCDGDTITKDDISMSIQGKKSSTQSSDYSTMQFKDAKDQFEKDYFSSLLGRCDNSITKCANEAGMAQGNVSRKLKQLGL